MTSAPPQDKFRLLIVDDEDEFHTQARDEFGQDSDVDVLSAYSQAEGLEAIDRYCLDAAIVDIELNPIPAGGYEVIRKFAEVSPETPIVVYTQHMDPTHVRDLVELVGDAPQIAKIVEKGPRNPGPLHFALVDVLEAWRNRRVHISNLGLALELLSKRSERIPRFRDREEEVLTELDRICGKLFGNVRGLQGNADIDVQLNPLDGEGLSSSITVEAKVILGDDARGEPVTGSRCVLKVGPVSEIREEVERYDQFVKYGVRLRQRVELLGHTCGYALAAVCYSFAGGVFGKALEPLGKLLESPDRTELAREAIASLFDVSSQSWYAVRCENESSLNYVANTYHTNFDGSYQRLNDGLANLAKRLRGPELQSTLGDYISFSKASEEDDGILEVGGRKLIVPRRKLLNSGKFATRLPACLVHGDMHGRNAMLELAESVDVENGNPGEDLLRRVCLIDYRSAGPGPRTTDAIALQASLRLADAKSIESEVDGKPDIPLTDEQLARATVLAVSRAEAELELVREVSRPVGENNGSGDSHWQSLDLAITGAMRSNFDDLTSMEYLAASLPFTLRYFGFPLGDIRRIRMLAWLSAQFTVFGEETSELRLPAIT